MLRLTLTAAALLLLAAAPASAYPYRLDCATFPWTAGGAFANMNVASFSDGAASSDCVISGVPAQATACQTYTVTITSSQTLGHKIAASAGVLAQSNTLYQDVDPRCFSIYPKVTTSTFVWQAPHDNSSMATVYALCGSYGLGKVFAAAARTSQVVSASANGTACVKLQVSAASGLAAHVVAMAASIVSAAFLASA